VRAALALGEPPPTGGNAVELLLEGRAAFERMFEAIDAATHHVHMEMYIFRDDRLGRALLERLERKARAGVEVRLLLDYLGSWNRWRIVRRLRKAGGRGALFLPVFPFGKRFLPNLRNHRKILVCDGRVAFFGGLNVGAEYLRSRRDGADWSDAHLGVRGPAVPDVQAVFAEDWDFATGERLEGAEYYPPVERAGDESVQVVSGGPDRKINPVRHVLLSAIGQARRRLWIASPYLVPDPGLRDALRVAALSGVEVHLMTQGYAPDNWLAHHAGRYYYPDYFDAGIRIHEYMAGTMHAKLALFDDDAAIVGSANLDNRSLYLNFEMLGIFTSPRTVRAVAERYLAMRGACREVTAASFATRPLRGRVAEGLCRLLGPLL
jgi:cardiolipin synthase